MYAAALEIDCVAAEPAHTAIADQIRDQWSQIHAQDPRTLEEGKLALVRRFGEAARTIDDRRQHGEASLELPGLPAAVCDRLPRAVLPGPARGRAGDRRRRRFRLPGAERGARRAVPDLRDERAGRAAASGPAASASRPAATATARRAWIISAWLAPMLVGSVDAAAPGTRTRCSRRRRRPTSPSGCGTSAGRAAARRRGSAHLAGDRARAGLQVRRQPAVRRIPTAAGKCACTSPSRRWRC